MWRSRSASYQNLSQQLAHPSVEIIKQRLEAYCQTESGVGSVVVDDFIKNFQILKRNTS